MSSEALLLVLSLKWDNAYLYLKYVIIITIVQLLNTVTHNHNFQFFGLVDHY